MKENPDSSIELCSSGSAFHVRPAIGRALAGTVVVAALLLVNLYALIAGLGLLVPIPIPWPHQYLINESGLTAFCLVLPSVTLLLYLRQPRGLVSIGEDGLQVDLADGRTHHIEWAAMQCVKLTPLDVVFIGPSSSIALPLTSNCNAAVCYARERNVQIIHPRTWEWPLVLIDPAFRVRHLLLWLLTPFAVWLLIAIIKAVR